VKNNCNYIKLIYLLSIVLPIISDIINKGNLVSLSIIIIVLGILMLLFNTRIGAIYFFLMALSFSDFTFEGVFSVDGEDTANLGGIYMGSIGGSTLMVYWSLITLLILLFRKGNIYIKIIGLSPLLKVFLTCLFFSLVGMTFNLIIGGNFVVQTIVSDIRIFVNVFLGYFIIMEICKNQTSITTYFISFNIIIITQCIITIYSSYVISSQRVIYNFFGGTESYYLGFVLLFLMMVFSKKHFKYSFFSNKFIVFFSMFVILLFLFVVASRGKILGVAIVVIIYLIYERKLGYVLLIPILLLLVFETVYVINPNFMSYFMWKITTVNPLEDGGESSRIRYISLLNIISEQLTNPYYFLFGKGLGGYFEASYFSFNSLLGEGSFNKAWIKEGKFYKPHGIFLYSLLKFGTVMTTVMFIVMFKYVIKVLSFAKKRSRSLMSNNRIYYIILVTSAICIPYIYIVMYSSKLQIMFGLTLGFITLSFFNTSNNSQTLNNPNA